MTGGLFLGISIIALVLFISLLSWVIFSSRRAATPILATAQPLPSGKNHHWIDHYEYKLSDFLPAPPEPLLVSPTQAGVVPAEKKPVAVPPDNAAEDEAQQLAAAELDAEAAHYAARAEAEDQSPVVPTAPVETYDYPFNTPAPTATDKHNTAVNKLIRANRAALAKSSRLAHAGNVLTKSQPA